MTQIIDATSAYRSFRDKVTVELDDLIQNGELSANLDKLLDGAAGAAVQTLVPKNTRSEFGIFFSGSALSEYVASRLVSVITKNSVIADPTCGAGDLLLACAKFLPVGQTLDQTVGSWSRNLIGIDIQPSFVETSDARLKLLAAKRMLESKRSLNGSSSACGKFVQLVHGNYFSHAERVGTADAVVMNPPFLEVVAPTDCVWGTGKVQLAGLFVESVVKHAKHGQHIVAILPDVLRSGSRYRKWRSEIASYCTINEVTVFGRFDSKTDVDVFVLYLSKGGSGRWSDTKVGASTEMSDTVSTAESFFKVSVGAYVPFRAKENDPIAAYLDVKSAPVSLETKAIKQCRFSGTKHKTPFVALRRTSSPSDKKRLQATLVTGPDEVAVENHLIVLSPKDGTLISCRKLMRLLDNPGLEDWVNSAIRCRHLTTQVIKKLPLVGWK